MLFLYSVHLCLNKVQKKKKQSSFYKLKLEFIRIKTPLAQFITLWCFSIIAVQGLPVNDG